jgi:hypothetical protein
VLLEEFSDSESVLRMTLDAEGEGLDCVDRMRKVSTMREEREGGRDEDALPWIMRKAEFGLSVAPMSRKPSMRTLAMKD